MYLGKYLGGCKNLEAHYGFSMDCCSQCKPDLEQGVAPVGYFSTSDGYYTLCCKHNRAMKTLELQEDEDKGLHRKF